MGTVKTYGAFHSAEIFYVFGNFVRPVKVEPEDTALSLEMMEFWVQFARTGNPNPKVIKEGAAAWPIYAADKDEYLELGDKVEVKSALYKDACDLVQKRLHTLEEVGEVPGADEAQPAAP
jgi:para-nitrobenzyl esterase